MSSKIFYSDEEQNIHQQNNQMFIENPFMRRVIQYQQSLMKIKSNIPLKDVIVFGTDSDEPLIDCSENLSKFVNQTFHTQQGLFKHENHATTRSRSGLQQQIQPVPELLQTPRVGTTAIQTKFRHRRFNRKRQTKSPYHEYFRHLNQNLKAQDPQQAKAIQLLYFSDDQESNSQKQIKAQERSSNVFQSEPSEQPQYEEEEIKSQFSQVMINQNEQREIITKDDLHFMFQRCSLHIQSVQYQQQAGQDPFFSAAFTEIQHGISYKRFNERSCHHLSKGRLFMIRKAMELYSNIPPKEHNEDKNIRNRLTNKDRQYFTKAKLPWPPCRLTTQFLFKLFTNKDFAKYFKEYVQGGKLNEMLIQKHKREVASFKVFFQKVSTEYESFEQKMKAFEAMVQPLSQLDVHLFNEQANKICNAYCKEA